MGGAKMVLFWRVAGVLLVLAGVYAIVFDGGEGAVIYLGGGAAMLLLLGRQRSGTVKDDEAEQ